jgi:hypothetical protein
MPFPINIRPSRPKREVGQLEQPDRPVVLQGINSAVFGLMPAPFHGLLRANGAEVKKPLLSQMNKKRQYTRGGFQQAIASVDFTTN